MKNAMKNVRKKVLVISSSARAGGNSDVLAERFAQGASDAGHAVEKIALRDRNINHCRGCGACNATHRCVQKGDMAALLDKLVAADVVALATPVYFYTLNGQMKTFIDRTVPRYTEIRDKDFYFIMAAAEDEAHTLDKTLACFRGFLDCLDVARERGVIRGTGMWKIGDVEARPEALRAAYEAGKNA